MKTQYKILFLVLSLTVILFGSCKTAFINSGKTENMRPAKLYKKLIENELQYENLSLKFSAEMFVGEESQEFSGIIRMQKDSAIWISLRSYNIEGARILFTQDSVKFINRLEKSYYVGDFDFIKKRFDIDMDYNMIQSIITNSFFFYPEPEDTSKAVNKFKPCYDSTLYCMSSISERKYEKYYIEDKKQDKWERKLEKEYQDSTVDGEFSLEANEFVFQFVKVVPDLYRVHNMFLENYVQEQSLYIEYGNQYLVESQHFPHEIDVELVTPRFESKVEIEIESVTIDIESMSFPFKISSKYKEIRIE